MVYLHELHNENYLQQIKYLKNVILICFFYNIMLWCIEHERINENKIRLTIGIGFMTILLACVMLALLKLYFQNHRKYINWFSVGNMIFFICVSFIEYQFLEVGFMYFAFFCIVSATSLVGEKRLYCLSLIFIGITDLLLCRFYWKADIRAFFLIMLEDVLFFYCCSSVNLIFSKSKEKEIEERYKEREKARELRLIDPLTSIRNRAGIEHFFQNIDTEEKSICFLLLDLDNFKNVNDSLGHIAGDYVLIESARLLENFYLEKEQKKICGRFGGDEFAVMILNQDIEEVKNDAEQIIKMMTRTLEKEGISIRVSCSIGGAVYEKKENVKISFERLYKEADEALYAVKNKGKSGYKIVKL